MAQRKYIYRSAVDGQFITRQEAEKKPRETVKEKIKRPSKSNTNKRKGSKGRGK